MNSGLTLRLRGGLGNQLFQYAAARSLALRNQSSFQIDSSSGFQGDSYGRNYELDAFNVVEQSCQVVNNYSVASKARWQYLRLREHLRMKYYGHYFDPLIYNLRIGGCFPFDFYCQSYRYFLDIENLIRQEFTFRTVPVATGELWLAAISETNSVCLHARRTHGHTANGLASKSVASYYGACELAYYLRALATLVQCHGALQVFMFSDDLKWAREHAEKLSSQDVEVRVVGEKDSLRSFYLMTQCKHFVIANSTYSWWAAWLGTHSYKTVCAPSIWNQRELRVPQDLFPNSWEIIDAR